MARTPWQTFHFILNEVAKSEKKDITLLERGAFFAKKTKKEIEQLCAKVTTDRIALAKDFLSAARVANNPPTPVYRTVIGRSYYSMYHAFRATAFFVYGGDDHQAHSQLPGKLPKDFPNKRLWENKLKTARLRRNEADYEPYPRSDASFKTTATEILDDAERLLPLVRKYLRKNGLAL